VPGSDLGVAEVQSRLPRGLPRGVAAIIANTLARDPGSLNTDWFGTTLMQGLQEWQRRGFPEVQRFARAWLAHHRRTTDVSDCQCPPSRRFAAGGVPITTYVGHYALAFPCFEMYTQSGDQMARRVCFEAANLIVHNAFRNRLGMVSHDDHAEFAIPDTAYFVTGPLMVASTLDPVHGGLFREQALVQLQAYSQAFLVKETGLAKTVLLPTGLGGTYWTRATAWLMWAITAVLRHLPANHARLAAILANLQRLAEGVARVQHPSGGLHTWLNDSSSPLESTGTAMCGMAIHEAVRRGWLPVTFGSVATRAWSFVLGNITPDGNLRRAYTGWAIPAERRELLMDTEPMAWIPGMILRAANEFTLPVRG
jgi:rhamnogalacturonyl hydrolase YesR